MKTHSLPRHAMLSRGFTLVEVMVVITILATLAAIAMSSYTKQTRESRRTDAKTAILDLAAREERNFSTTNQYSANPAFLGYTGAFPITIGAGYYTLDVTALTVGVAGGAPASYTLTAQAVGDQAKDTSCFTYTYTQAGVQQTVNTGGADTTATCWR